jgi:hypothetical protein
VAILAWIYASRVGVFIVDVRRRQDYVRKICIEPTALRSPLCLVQRTEVPVRPGHPGGHCYKIRRGYASVERQESSRIVYSTWSCRLVGIRSEFLRIFQSRRLVSFCNRGFQSTERAMSNEWSAVGTLHMTLSYDLSMCS